MSGIGGGVAGTSNVLTGYAEQTVDGLQQGTYNLVRTSGAVVEGSGSLVQGQILSQGMATANAVDQFLGSVTIPWESDKEEENVAGHWPISAVLRASTLAAPAAIAFTGSYQIETGATLSDGTTGTRILDVAGADFAALYGEVDFGIRITGATAAENNRFIAVKRAFDDAGNSTLELVVGYQAGSAPDPAALPNTYYGHPMANVTESFTIQVGKRITQGTSGAGTRRCFSFLQQFTDMVPPRFHGAQYGVLSDLTLTIAPSENVAYEVSGVTGRVSENAQVNPALPTITSTAAQPGTLTDGVVAKGAVTMALDGMGATTTIVAGEVFSVAGVAGKFVFLQNATADGLGALAAPAGDFFEPAAPFGGFADNAAITIESGGAHLTPTAIVPAATATSRGDGTPGAGVRVVGLVTRNTDDAIQMDCSGWGGLTGATLTLTGGNNQVTGDTCISPKHVTRGTLIPTASLDLNLIDDPTEDRPDRLTRLGITPTKEKAYLDIIFEHALEGAEVTPSAVWWMVPNAQVTAFSFVAGPKDGEVTGTVPIEGAQPKNASDELGSPVSWQHFPAI